MSAGNGLAVEVSAGDPAVVTVVGEIDLLTAADFGRPLRELLQHRRPAVIDLDLTGVSFMDSTGIQVLVATYTDALAAGTALRVVAASDPVLRVLRLTGLLDALGVQGGR